MNGPLTTEQIARFQQRGYLVCPNLLDSPEQARIADMIAELSGWPATDDRWQHYHEQTPNGSVITRTENFLPYHEGLRQALTTGTLVDSVGQLFAEPAVVFKEKINYKLPGGGGFSPHQDAQAYAYGTSHITCLVAADDHRQENGCLWFAPGAHRQGLLETDDTGCLASRVVDQLEWEAAPMNAGGVTFFSSFVPHRSSSNDSQHARRTLYVTYSRESEGDLRTAYYEERARQMAEHNSSSGEPPRISTIGHFQGKGID